MKTKSCLLLFTAPLLVSALTTHAQLLFSFEGGLDGWAASGFNAKPVVLGNSAIGATDGAQSMAITQTGDGFSWNAVRNNSGADAFYNAMNTASMNPSLYQLEMDVTYRDASIPDGSVTYLNLSLWFNSDAPNFPAVHSKALTTGHQDVTLHLAIPLTEWNNPPFAQNSSYYQMGIGMNGDWGTGDATVYFDNIRLSQVPEPSTTVLLLLGGLAGFCVLHYRRKTNR